MYNATVMIETEVPIQVSIDFPLYGHFPGPPSNEIQMNKLVKIEEPNEFGLCRKTVIEYLKHGNEIIDCKYHVNKSHTLKGLHIDEVLLNPPYRLTRDQFVGIFEELLKQFNHAIF